MIIHGIGDKHAAIDIVHRLVEIKSVEQQVQHKYYRAAVRRGRRHVARHSQDRSVCKLDLNSLRYLDDGAIDDLGTNCVCQFGAITLKNSGRS